MDILYKNILKNAWEYNVSSICLYNFRSRHLILQVKVKFTLEQATKAQRRRRGIAILLP
jgi:hypothetical protein